MSRHYPELVSDSNLIRSSDTDSPLSADAQLKNNTRYLYFKKIAQGGKCLIQSCKDLHLGRVICYKSLRPELADNEVEKKLFLREARVTAMLQHPNTPPVYEVGFDAKGMYYFTMKLVSGRTLREIFDEDQNSGGDSHDSGDLYRWIDAVIQVGQVLSYAHAHGVVHCDVKPENVVVGAFGEVLLLDWGLAHLTSEDSQQNVDTDVDQVQKLRSQESHQGTPQYMSPEQISGAELDHRTDIYSLGAMLFEALTGRQLAWGDTLDEMLQNKLNSPPPPFSVVAPDRKIPTALETLCRRCVERDRDHRIQTALEVIHELLYWMRTDTTFRPV